MPHGSRCNCMIHPATTWRCRISELPAVVGEPPLRQLLPIPSSADEMAALAGQHRFELGQDDRVDERAPSPPGLSRTRITTGKESCMTSPDFGRDPAAPL